MKWAFVDYENTGSLEAICLTDFAKVFVFCGPNHKKINFGSLSNTAFCNVELLSIKKSGANNLDFHLSFYLGNFHQIAEREIEFHIISNDNGFNGIIEHLNDIGRKSVKIETKTSTKVNKVKLSDNATLVISRLEQLKESNRPNKEETIRNFVKSQCKVLETDSDVEKVVNELILNKKIEINDSNVSYHIKVISKQKNLVLSEGASLALTGLKQVDGRKRPRKKDKLLNWIKSQCKSITPKVKTESVYDELIKERLITESNQNMSYHIKK